MLMYLHTHAYHIHSLHPTAAQLAAAGAARRAAIAGTTATPHDDDDGQEVQVRMLPPQDPAVAALLERARAMARQAVAEIFRGLRLEDGGEEVGGWVVFCGLRGVG